MSINRCELCYEKVVSGCESTITFNVGLTPSTSYTVFLEDQNSNIYTRTLTTNGSGAFTLTVSDFPDGMFNAYSGSYEISVSTSSSIDTSEELTISGNSYYCILLKFQKQTDVTP